MFIHNQLKGHQKKDEGGIKLTHGEMVNIDLKSDLFDLNFTNRRRPSPVLSAEGVQGGKVSRYALTRY